MRPRAWIAVVALVLLWLGTSAPATQSATDALRVVTYNIHHGEGTDGNLDLPRLAGIVSSLSPDLVALQEVDEGTARAGGVFEMEELSRLTGLHAVFGKAMDFQGGGFGVGVLSRVPVQHVENHPLPVSPEHEPRTVLTVDVSIEEDGPLLHFSSTHFSQGRELEDRLAQAERVNELLAREDASPSILAGDMNSRPDTEVMQKLATRWTDLFPQPQAPPDVTARGARRVDYVLARPAGRWRTVESRVIDAPIASDHRPVLVVLQRTD